MKVFLAGTVMIVEREKRHVPLYKRRLVSFHYIDALEKIDYKVFRWLKSHIRRKVQMKNKVDLFLDSGAFSAWSQGASIDIYEYIEFIKKHKDVLTVYANLDVLPKGNDPKNKEEAAIGTLANQRIMEEAGLNPLPVFHVGEPIKYLQYYIDRYDYMGFGGMVGQPKHTLLPWLDSCFRDYICDSTGMPKIKVHGFGLTSHSLMLRYPWYSVDSTSWILAARMGSIYIPRKRNGEWIYGEDSWKVAVSSRSPGKSEAGKHIETFSPREREIILEYIHMKGYRLGKSSFKKMPHDYSLLENERWAEKRVKNKHNRLVEVIEEEGVSNRYQLRYEMNIIYFQDLEQSMPEWPWSFKLTGVKGLGI